MINILGISGKKQAGKNTLANYINGRIIKSLGTVKDFGIDLDNGGSLLIQTTNASGEIGWGIFDVTRKDSEFAEYAERELWPYVKLYSFADGLKSLCVEFFGLSYNQVHGTDEQKNTKTDLMWEDMPTWGKWSLEEGPMTAREVMQYFGTNIMRKMNEQVHVNHAIKSILSEKSQLAIIPDVRFPNEVEAIQNAGGKVLRLTRDISDKSKPTHCGSMPIDLHSSECALDEESFNWNKFDFILDNDKPEEEMLKTFGQFYDTNLAR